MVGLCHGSFLAGLDRFYLEQRVRNFIGNGLRLYSETFSWRAPFLDLAWIRAAWNLKRSWKFGSNWHRFAINSNCPNLLNYTEQGISSIMSRRAKLFYWTGRRNKQPIVPYANYEDWYCGKDIVGFLRENINVVSDVIDPTLVEEIIVEHLLKKNRARAISFIISLMFWLLNLKEIRCENN
jgi:hypothetical protein